MQGKDKTTIDFIDLLSALTANLELRERKLERGNIRMLPVLSEFVEDYESSSLNASIISHVIAHLQLLRHEFAKYFPEKLKTQDTQHPLLQ